MRIASLSNGLYLLNITKILGPSNSSESCTEHLRITSEYLSLLFVTVHFRHMIIEDNILEEKKDYL